MKKKNVLAGLIAGCMVLMTSALAAQNKSDLTVEIKGLRSNKGKVMIALTEKEIPTDMKILAADMAAADSTGMQFHFEGLTDGKYYLQVFHDENANFTLDMSPEGKPTEGVGGFPNSQERPSVLIEGESKKAEITILYF